MAENIMGDGFALAAQIMLPVLLNACSLSVSLLFFLSVIEASKELLFIT